MFDIKEIWLAVGLLAFGGVLIVLFWYRDKFELSKADAKELAEIDPEALVGNPEADRRSIIVFFVFAILYFLGYKYHSIIFNEQGIVYQSLRSFVVYLEKILIAIGILT